MAIANTGARLGAKINVLRDSQNLMILFQTCEEQHHVGYGDRNHLLHGGTA